MNDLGLKRNIEPLIGLPYESRGRGPVAFDCWGYAIMVNRVLFGIELPDYREYHDSDDLPEAALTIWEHTQDKRWRSVSEAWPGDLFVFRIGRFACHTGVNVGQGNFLHCLRGRGSTLESIHAIDWRDRLQSIWRWTDGAG